MIQCDLQGRNCKIWYHGDCVGVSKSQGKHMERCVEDFICPPCSIEISENADGVDCTAPSPVVALPPYVELPVASFHWKVSTAYDEVVHWQRNLFLVPYGRVGRDFVHELAKLFLSYGKVGPLEVIAIKATMLMCALLLQKPHE